jgi:hypothetical protein
MLSQVRVFVMVGVVVAGLLASVRVVSAERAGPGGLCERGEFCLWAKEGYRGEIGRVSLSTANPGECVAVPEGRSFANRMARYVTVYQDGTCSTEGEFDTYPGGGTYVPEAPHVVRAIQIWPEVARAHHR